MASKSDKTAKLATAQEKPKKKRKWDLFDVAQKALSSASNLAAALVLLRDKPRKLDWFAVGMAVTNVLLTARNEIKRYQTVDPWQYYDPEIHERIPPAMRMLFIDLSEDTKTVASHDSYELLEADLGGAKVYWRKYNNNVDFGPFCKKEDVPTLYKAIGERLWTSIGSDHAVLTEDQNIDPTIEEADFTIHETTTLREFKERVQKFLDAGITRSFLLEGSPGTGKSSAVVYLIQSLKLRSFRTTISALTGNNWDGARCATDSLEGLLMALRPDVLVLDDIDRGWLGRDGLLKLFEVARRYCKLIVATANNKDHMVGAMLRVGRFDDHIKFEGVDVEVLRAMLDAEDHELIKKFQGWPIAYIQNFITTKSVMGRDVAIGEIEDIDGRIKDIDKKTKSKAEKVTGEKAKEEESPTPVAEEADEEEETTEEEEDAEESTDKVVEVAVEVEEAS